jgi:hypothetical protein
MQGVEKRAPLGRAPACAVGHARMGEKLMRYAIVCTLVVSGALLGGCPLSTLQDNNTPGTVVAGDVAVYDPNTADADLAAAPAGARTVTGAVSAGEYALVELGTVATGSRWRVAGATGQLHGHTFLLTLFNSDYELLQRQLVSSSTALEHVVRADTTLYLGIAPAFGGSGGDYGFTVSALSDVAAPAPARATVYLNFAGGDNVRVQSRGPYALTPFDAADAGAAYAGLSDTMKAAIMAAVREDYAAYDVVVCSSDDGPPVAPCAILQFGGYDSALLGLADNVDQYNVNPGQAAIIYVESFRDFEIMQLTATEMGQMIGNVASHEFGHLLGLFHTRLPSDVMDTTGTAWDLAENQTFQRADLEASVFPFGSENCPRRLGEVVGWAPAVKNNSLAKTREPGTMQGKPAVRALARDALRGRCGTCLHLDE